MLFFRKKGPPIAFANCSICFFKLEWLMSLRFAMIFVASAYDLPADISSNTRFESAII